jgi:hypothetical protein
MPKSNTPTSVESTRIVRALVTTYCAARCDRAAHQRHSAKADTTITIAATAVPTPSMGLLPVGGSGGGGGFGSSMPRTLLTH